MRNKKYAGDRRVWQLEHVLICDWWLEYRKNHNRFEYRYQTIELGAAL